MKLLAHEKLLLRQNIHDLYSEENMKRSEKVGWEHSNCCNPDSLAKTTGKNEKRITMIKCHIFS